MPLENAMEFITKHRAATGGQNYWYNKYGALFAIVPTYQTVQSIIADVINAERIVHLSAVRFIGAIGRPFRAKTIQPNPNPPIIDPTDIVTHTSFLLGSRSYSSLDRPMSKQHIMQVDRQGEFGRAGWLEFRGALLQSEVKQSLEEMTEEDAFVLDGLVDSFAEYMGNIALDNGFEWVRFSQPSTLTEVEVVGKKVIKHYTYGPPVTIPIQTWTLRGIRLDQSNNKYFDHA